MKLPEKTKSLYTKDILLVLAASFFYMATPMIVTPLITGFSETLGTSGVLMGIIGGLTNISSLLCRPFLGNIADKISKYKLAFIGAGFLLAACIGYVVAVNPVMVIVSRIIHGIGYACCSVCLSTWMSNMLPRDKIGYGMGMYGSVNALGMAVTPAVGVYVYQVFGYRVSFMLSLIASALVILLIQFIQDKGMPIVHEEVTAKTHKKTPFYLQIVDMKVLPVAAIMMLFAIPYFANQSFIVRYTETRHIAVSISWFFPFYAAALLILRLSLRNLFDKLPFGKFVFACSICMALSLLILTMMNNNLFMFAAAMLLAASYGIMCSVCQSTAILLADEDKRGLANGTYYTGLDLGMACGPMIGGFLYGHIDLAYFYPIMLFVIPLCFIIYFAFCRK